MHPCKSGSQIGHEIGKWRTDCGSARNQHIIMTWLGEAGFAKLPSVDRQGALEASADAVALDGITGLLGDREAKPGGIIGRIADITALDRLQCEGRHGKTPTLGGVDELGSFLEALDHFISFGTRQASSFQTVLVRTNPSIKLRAWRDPWPGDWR